MKTFTLDEAQSLLPLVESLLNRAMEARQAAQAIEDELTELSHRIFLMGGMRVDLERVIERKAELDSHGKRAKESVAEIDAIGVQVKDIEAGLLDFPCRLDGEIVLLCWKRGETEIGFWHSMESGFRGRQVIDDRFRRRSAMGGRPN